jgi:8-oxo-dGTP pyrophosphatase MutT (NUDIX family)
MAGFPDDDRQLLEQLTTALASGQLPGQKAQSFMSPGERDRFGQVPTDHRRAAVMALFHFGEREDSQLQLTFIRRSSRDARDRHAGQISFPGGSVEPQDDNLATTALRETEEEIGVPAGKIELLGELTDLYIPVSNFLVTPFVGFLAEKPVYVPQVTEVDEVIELPFAHFLRPQAKQTSDRTLVNGLRLTKVPYWSVKEIEVWGATAMMTSELVALMKG